MPDSDDTHLTPATRLLEKRREMVEVQQSLSAQKDEFSLKMESLRQRRDELERKEYQLKESLLKFDKFLKENDSKRARADKKASDERQYKESKIREIIKLKEELRDLKGSRQKQITVLQKHISYQQYLERVLEIAEEFSEIRDAIARYDTLVATNEDLLETQRNNQDENERLRTHLLKYTEDKNNEVLNYNNQLATMQTQLEEAQSKAFKWETQWNHILNSAAKKTLLLGQVKMATRNLFSLVNKHLKMQMDKHSTAEQLHKIQEFIQDLTDITAKVNSQQDLQ